MIVCTPNSDNGRIQVKHYPRLTNVSKTATFDFSEEISVIGLSFSREARRLHADGRLFIAECSGVCLNCSNPFNVYRIVHSSGPLPAHHSAVDFEHGYRKAKIYDMGQDGLANSHLLEDVLHHGSFYGFWLETWSKARPWALTENSDLGAMLDKAIEAAGAVAHIYRDAHKVTRAKAGIV